jgi:hypothetical protein
MIEANQLRIGNWVLHGDAPSTHEYPNTIFQISVDFFYEMARRRISEHHIEPIPLTATILEQSGFIKGKPFEKTGHVPYHDKEYKGFVIIDCLDGTFWLADYKPYDVKIEFVHLLQNVYYFLIGSELNIQL